MQIYLSCFHINQIQLVLLLICMSQRRTLKYKIKNYVIEKIQAEEIFLIIA